MAHCCPQAADQEHISDSEDALAQAQVCPGISHRQEQVKAFSVVVELGEVGASKALEAAVLALEHSQEKCVCCGAGGGHCQ